MDSSSSVSTYDDLNLLLVTANVGSLFEDPRRLLRPWLSVFLEKVEEIQPKFLALHLQEVGGKTYEKSMEYVQDFIQSLCEASQMLNFEFIRIYMDEDYNSAENFTALGNLYFIDKSLKNVNVWNFLTHNWELAKGKNIYCGNIETISSKEKSKFPQHFFPECKWSRKGFMRSRWLINNTAFDLVNIHLFHDASNLAACEEYPSVYCKTRRRALVHTLERLHLDEKNGLAPFFVFGDFNFRCDTEGVIKELTENLTTHRIHSMQNDCTKIHYRNSGGDNILTIGKKEFNHADHQLKFKEAWLKKFDREIEPLTEFLIEFPINFPPSYPYEEDPEMPTDYMSTRCPSWCDRVLMSVHAKEIIDETKIPGIYNIMGENVCMGDHKPVYLNIRLKSNQDADDKSNHQIESVLKEVEKLNIIQSSHKQGNTSKTLSTKWPSISINIIDSDNINVCMCSHISVENSQDNNSFDGNICRVCRNIIKKQPIELSNNIIVNRIDTQHLSTFFDMGQKYQDPYTPESAESHSPCPELSNSTTTSCNSRSLFNTDLNNECLEPQALPDFNLDVVKEHVKSKEDVDSDNAIQSQQRRVVSPKQLKSRLEDLQKKTLKQNLKFRSECDEASRDTAGDIDVEYVDETCRMTNVAAQQYSNSCLPKCCNIH